MIWRFALPPEPASKREVVNEAPGVRGQSPRPPKLPKEGPRLCGGPGDLLPLLQAMQIIGGALRMRGCCEDGAVIAL
jgi:hypothetical protein